MTRADRPLANLARSGWPGAAVLGLGLWLTWPLWTTPDRVLAGQLASDNVVTAWYYDFVARALASGSGLERLTDFNHPWPIARESEFPALVDAILAAPAAWLLGWPRQYGGAMATAVLLNGLGAAALARVLGARGIGLAVAGALGLVCRPVWKDLVMGRMNAAWPGLALLALAAWLALLRPAGGPRPGWRQALLVLAAGGLGAAAALTYPPYLALLAVVAAPVAVEAARGAGGGSRLLALLALAVGGALAWHELGAIFGRQASGACASLTCPDTWWAVDGRNLFLGSPVPAQGLSMPGVPLAAWVLAPLLLLDRRWRWAGLGALALAGLGALLSLGPCPAWGGERLALPGWPVVGAVPSATWCALAHMHDFGRYATVSVLLAGVAGGVGLGALARGATWRRAAAVLAGAGVVGHLVALLHAEIMDPRKWQRVDPSPVAAFLREVEPGPVVELPFDRSAQFLSVLEAPGPPRVNPVRPGDRPPVPGGLLGWLHGIGRGEVAPAPTEEELRLGPVRWVVFDTNRCERQPPPAGCGAVARDALESLLGRPTRAPGMIYWWDLDAVRAREGRESADVTDQPPHAP